MPEKLSDLNTGPNPRFYIQSLQVLLSTRPPHGQESRNLGMLR
jgi:hypothetical protein